MRTWAGRIILLTEIGLFLVLLFGVFLIWRELIPLLPLLPMWFRRTGAVRSVSSPTMKDCSGWKFMIGMIPEKRRWMKLQPVLPFIRSFR